MTASTEKGTGASRLLSPTRKGQVSARQNLLALDAEGVMSGSLVEGELVDWGWWIGWWGVGGLGLVWLGMGCWWMGLVDGVGGWGWSGLGRAG